jgi:hypothetical protein
LKGLQLLSVFFHFFFQDGDVSLCSIANDIRNDSEYDLTDSLEPAKILNILNTAGCSIYAEADFHSKTDRQHDMMIKAMQKCILGYVRSTCGCVL